MTNTIVDIMRIPTDKYGAPLYDFNDIQKMIEQYNTLFPTHQVIAMPDQIKIWEDLDIDILKYFKQQLEEVIQKKEKQDKES